MDELVLPVTYNGQDYDFPLRIVSMGYVYQFAVQVNSTEVIFERDDSGHIRAIVYNQDVVTGQSPNQGLLAAIAAVLEQL